MINNLPNGWKIEELKNIGDFIRGVSYNKNDLIDELKENDITLLRANNIKDRLYLDDFQYLKKQSVKEKQLLLYGDILIAMSSGSKNLVGKNVYIDKDLNNYSFGAFCSVFRTKNIENSKYVSHFFKSNYFKNSLSLNGTNINNLRISELEQLKIPIPPLQQQEKIVKILDLTSNLIEKQKELLRAYDLFLKSKFIEMFGDPIKNPMGWEVVPFSKLANIKTKSIKAENISNEIYIGLDCIEKDTSKLLFKYDAEKEEIKSNKYIFTSEMILYGKLRPYLNKVLLPSFSGICSTDILPIEPIKNISTKEYLAYFLKDKNTVELLSNSVSGANLPRVSPQILKDLKIFETPFELQNKFASIVEKIETIKEKENQKLKQLEDLHNSLMQKAFKGEIQ